MFILMPLLKYYKLLSDLLTLAIDLPQRSILFSDTMVKRGVQTLQSKDYPNVVKTPYTTVMSGKEDLSRPTNYSLIKLQRPPDSPVTQSRPFIGISPRASRLSGIEALMKINQATVAMGFGYVSYWIVFDRNPIPGQTIEDVIWTIGEFIKKVNSLHSQNPKGAVVAANCQSGWASFFKQLQERVPFTLIPIASPLSYHAGCGERSMRFFAGLTGGYWPVAASGDSRGFFDGADLAANFERHSGPGAILGRFLRTFFSIDKEADDFLLMERWWNFYSIFDPNELPWILKNLFVGNLPEQGLLALDGKQVDMRDHNDTVIFFCSNGDDIATPASCLCWIKKVYVSIEKLKESGKRIIFLIHPDAGHLKIFLSGTVATKWFGGILANLEDLENLPSGLYRAQLTRKGFVVTEVSFEDLPQTSTLEEEVMQKIALAAEQFYLFYKNWVRPLMKFTPPLLGHLAQQLHPLRVQRWPFIGAEFNPLFKGLDQLVPVVKKLRVKAEKDNCFFSSLTEASNSIVTCLNFWNTTVSTTSDFFVQMIFGLTVPARINTKMFE